MNDYGYCKSEAAFKGWLSQAMRKAWLKHPSRLEVLKATRRRVENKATGRLCFQHQCCKCKKWYKQVDVEVNHKHTVGGFELRDFGVFASRLMLVKTEHLEVVCKGCHEVITYSERSGMSIEDAAIEKKVIKFMKENSPKEQKAKLLKVGIEPASTIKGRRDQVRSVYQRKFKKEETE